jgi:diguanylate cyclase (GGDEF)-like protein
VQNGTRQERLDVERIKTLYSNARFSIAGVFISTFFFSLFLWNSIDTRIWLVWIALIVAINLPRLLLAETFNKKYRQQDLINENLYVWERRFYAGVVLSSLSWSAVSFFPFQGDLLQSLVYAALILIGMSSASIVTLITSLKMGLTFLAAAILPLIARSLWEEGEGFDVLAAVCAAYVLIFTRMAQRLHYTIIDNISLKLENRELSLKDALTGLWNRRELYLFVNQLRTQVERSGEAFSIILMDLDRFKQYNDSHGHNAGDEMLVAVAAIISRESRDEDLVVRYGGEEFLVVLPRTGTEQASSVAERIRRGVKAQTTLSISAGIATYTLGLDFDTMTAQADRALYAAKEGGRDVVIEYGQLTQPTT